MKKLLAGAFALSLVLGACGSDKKDDDKADATTTTTEASKDSAALDAKLLTLADLPQGFEADDSSDDNSEDDEIDCAELDKIDKDLPTKYESSASFQAAVESEVGLVNEDLSQYDSTDDATDAMGRAKTAFAGTCDTFSDTDDDGTVTKVTLAPLTLDKFGEESFAHSVTIDITGDLDDDASTENQTVTLKGALIVIRKGDTISQVTLSGTSGLEPTTDDFKAVAEKAAAKL